MSIAVIGLGKLGAPLVAVLASKGFDVRAYDRNPEAWNQLPPEPGLADLVGANLSRITLCEHPEDAVAGTDAVFVIVPTPSGPDGQFINDHLLAAIRSVRPGLMPETVVNIVSTVMPGSCDSVIRKALPECQPLTYSPEFIALGSVVHDLQHPDHVLIGESDRAAGDIIAAIQRKVVGPDTPIHRMSLASAELAKVMTNAFLCMKIGFANFLQDMAEKVAASPHEVAAALGADHRIGPAFLKPGLGFGGPCLPRDTKAVTSLAYRLDLNPMLIDAADRMNLSRAAKVEADVLRITREGDRVAVLGQAYKPGTPVTEASQGVQIADWLRKAGRKVVTCDPMAPADTRNAADAVLGAACIVVATSWPEFAVLRTKAPIIDPWGVLQ